MERRPLGRSGIEVSVLGYGCGAIGGLMVRGAPAEQERAIARALEHGITYFDTATAYGDGASETNLGRVLKALGVRPTIGTKVRIRGEQRADIAGMIRASVEASLGRLGLDAVDILHRHDPITAAGEDPAFTPAQVLEEAVPALQRLRDAGKIRVYGITGLGDPAAVARVLDEGGFASAQMPYNLLNPSGIAAAPVGMPDLGGVIRHAAGAGVGVMAIRILAGGALSGTEARHPVGAQSVAPIGSGATYAADVALARRFLPVVEAGHAGDLVELAFRYAAMPPEVSTILLGSSSVAELDHAAAAIARGPLPDAAMAMIAAIQAG